MRVRLVQMDIIVGKSLWYVHGDPNDVTMPQLTMGTLVALTPRDREFRADIKLPIEWLPPDSKLGDVFNLFIEKSD